MDKLTTIVLCFFCFITQNYGQNNSTVNEGQKLDSALVIVVLKNQSQVKGYINDWVIGEYIDLRTSWAANFVISSDLIKTVKQLNIEGMKPYNFKEIGYYATVKGQYITGNNGDRANGSGGYGVSLSVGKKYSRWAAVGFGVGFDKYIKGAGENLFPIFAEFTSYLQEKNNSLFFSLQTGYSLAFKSDRYNILEARGGLMAYPSLGLRLGDSQTKYTIDLGYKFQRASFTYQDFWGDSRSEQRISYKRLTLRLGILI